MDSSTHHALEKESVIVVANHPYEGEAIAILASLPKRRDIYLVVNATMMHISKQLDRHFIPVYIQHHISEEKGKNRQSRLLDKLHPAPTYTAEEEHQKNVENIALAGKKLIKGATVVIFPNPGERNEVIPWFPGVGHMIKAAQKQKHLSVVFAYVKGTSNMDYLRLIAHSGKILPPITVTYSKPQKVRLLLSLHPKKIAATLEKEYRNWVKTL